MLLLLFLFAVYALWS